MTRRYTQLTQPQIARAVQLARAGLSDGAVAIVLNLDMGLDIGPEQVRHHRLRAGIRRTEVHGARLPTARVVATR